MITLEKVDGATLEAEAEKAGITLPIEQTKVWSGFQADIDGRTPWGDYLIKRDGELVAVISFIDFETHGYHYLRSMHGPAWVAKPTEAEEREVVDAIVDNVKKADKNIAFLRIDTWFADGTEKVLSTVPYDQTVVIDVTGGDDEILADSLECFSSAVERYGAPDVLGAGVCSGSLNAEGVFQENGRTFNFSSRDGVRTGIQALERLFLQHKTLACYSCGNT